MIANSNLVRIWLSFKPATYFTGDRRAVFPRQEHASAAKLLEQLDLAMRGESRLFVDWMLCRGCFLPTILGWIGYRKSVDKAVVSSQLPRSGTGQRTFYVDSFQTASPILDGCAVRLGVLSVRWKDQLSEVDWVKLKPTFPSWMPMLARHAAMSTG